VAWLGDDVFFAGLRAHFAKHAYANATLADLLESLGAASGRDLSEWSRLWLRTPQVSTLRPDVTVDADGRYATVDVIQTAPPLAPGEEPVLRPHRINVVTGMLGADGVMQPGDVVAVSVDGPRTRIDALVGKPVADLLLLNDGDLTFAKIRLDDASMDRLAATLPTVRDSLTRALLWGAAWDATRDAELPASAFVDIAAAGLPTEDNVVIFATVVRYALFAIDRFMPLGRRPAARVRIGEACRTALVGAEAGSGQQLVAARSLIYTTSLDDAAWLRSWLDDDDDAAPAGLQIDFDLRWVITQQLAVLGAVSRDDIDAEYARDRTAMGAINAAKARASRPDPAAKQAAWTEIIEDDSLSNHLLFATAEGFWQPDQGDLTSPYVQRFVTDMPAMAARRVPQVAEFLVRAAYPAFSVDREALEALTAMATGDAMTPGLTRHVRDGNDDLARALAVRAVPSD